MTEDSKIASKLERRREREKRVISQMIAIYCNGNHREGDGRDGHKPSCKAYCGEAICEECLKMDDYAVERTQMCRNMSTKTNCEECENHCYVPEMRRQIRAVMRYAGPRMIYKHPISAIRHLLGR